MDAIKNDAHEIEIRSFFSDILKVFTTEKLDTKIRYPTLLSL